MDNNLNKGGNKTLQSIGYTGIKNNLDIGSTNKNVIIAYGCSSHTGYGNVCYLQGSDDNSNFVTIDSFVVPDDFNCKTSDNNYGCLVRTLYNQPYRYYRITFKDASSHGLGAKFINAIW